jgi:hypothetical protein
MQALLHLVQITDVIIQQIILLLQQQLHIHANKVRAVTVVEIIMAEAAVFVVDAVQTHVLVAGIMVMVVALVTTLVGIRAELAQAATAHII